MSARTLRAGLIACLYVVLQTLAAAHATGVAANGQERHHDSLTCAICVAGHRLNDAKPATAPTVLPPSDSFVRVEIATDKPLTPVVRIVARARAPPLG